MTATRIIPLLPPNAETDVDERPEDRPPPADRRHLGLPGRTRRIDLGHRNLRGPPAEPNRTQVEVRFELVLVEPGGREIEPRVGENGAAEGAEPVGRFRHPAPR